MEIRIEIIPQAGDTKDCLVSETEYDALQLSPDKKYDIHLGQLAVSTCLHPDSDHAKSLRVSPKLAEQLLLCGDEVLNVYRKDQDIYLGPVVGVFTRGAFPSNFMEGDTPQYHALAGRMEHCICYYFSPDDVCWDEKRIKGCYYILKENKWDQRWFPMPCVIYDRGSGFSKDQKPLINKMRERLRSEYGIRFINSTDYLGKWELYRNLSKHCEISCYLPPTRLYSNFNDILIMLKQYDFVFVKSSYGSRGREVLSIEDLHGKFRLSFYSGELKTFFLDNAEDLQKHVEGFAKFKKGIVQQGIHLLKYNNRVFDMRILVMKDRRGMWKAMNNYARIAHGDFTITNYSAGGECDYYTNIYPQLIRSYPGKRIPDYNELAAAAERISQCIDVEFGSFGEVGVDVGIDEHGRIWFFEANSKPDKDLVPGLDNLDAVDPQYLGIFEYARYLSGFVDV